MVNDINTLNGSLQALGEKMASNLTTMGVPSTYDEGLNTLADKILQVAPVKTLDHLGVELIAGNQILSYADEQQTPDSQYATVRFTAYADAGETETIPNLSLDFKVGSGAVTQVVTDSNGRYEYTYHSQGVGDVEIVASKTVEGILVSETYDIEDCLLYDTNSYNSVKTLNLSLPSAFVITWQSNRKSNSTSICRIDFGADSGNMFQAGSYGSIGNNGLQECINGSWQTAQNTNNSPLNTIQNNTLTYSNGSLSYSNGSQTVSKIPTVSLDKLIALTCQTNGLIQNVKFKPL